MGSMTQNEPTTEGKKECRQIGCEATVQKENHVYCHKCFVEYQAWLHTTDRQLKSFAREQKRLDPLDDRGGLFDDACYEDTEEDVRYNEDQEWPNLKL